MATTLSGRLNLNGSGHARKTSSSSVMSRASSVSHTSSGPAPRIPPKSIRRDTASSSRSPTGASFPVRGLQSRSRGRPIRSQYPDDSQERHVEYILLASFDIDKGPTMEHQYPGAISGDENMLAELMLPDGAHLRSEDWTIFFLHKDTTDEEELREERRLETLGRREDRQKLREVARQNADTHALDDIGEDTEDEDEDDGAQGPPLIYVLNLVNTKQDNAWKR